MKRTSTPDSIFERLAQAITPAELGLQQRSRLRDRIRAAVASSAPPPGTRTLRAADGEWTEIAPLVLQKVLRLDRAARSQTVLIRMQPGSSLHAHVHTQEEECYVVEGEISIGAHRLRAGDMHVAAPGSQHAIISTRTGALLMVRSEISELQT